MHTLLGPCAHCPVSACGLRSPNLRCALSTHASDLGLIPPTPPQECQAVGWRGDWSCCCRIPQSSSEGLFLFGKILLLKSCCSIQGRACPLTQPTSPASPGTVWVRALHGPTLNSPHPTHTVSVGLPDFILIPLPVTSNNQVSLGAAQTLFVRGGSC